MKAKLVSESLQEFRSSVNEEKVNEAKEKSTTVVQSSDEKAKQAIASLKKELAAVKKPGGAKTMIEKKAKIKELEDKIAKWEAKMKK